MHIHILGICGTFMGSLALIARELGHTVTGSDANVYPPMSTQLEQAGVVIQEGYLASHLDPTPDLVVVGNAMKRGIEAVEYMLNQGMAYTSGPQFLAEQVLQHRHVLAVAGTHGKTTTTTMLAWILQYAGIDTGFLIGGVPQVGGIDDEQLKQVFTHSSHLGVDNANTQRGYFVIEADEYDSAFFDKRSKFVHYRPNTAILNNLEFDHADIFADLNAIATQFHHMIRMIPSEGRIVMPANTTSLEDTIDKGCWTPIWRTSVNLTNDANTQADDNPLSASDWQAKLLKEDGSQFEVCFSHHDDSDSNEKNKKVADTNTAQTSMTSATIKWGMSGVHNVNNALVAIAAAYHVGVSIEQACEALSCFSGIKRRMELVANISYPQPIHNQHKGDKSNIAVQIYDDFAHHPTAITTTLDGACKKLSDKKIWAIIEPRSNTMKLGIHKNQLALSASVADEVIWYEPKGLEWGLNEVITNANTPNKQQVFASIDDILDYVSQHLSHDTAIIIMSNGGFEGIHQKLHQRLNKST